MCGVPYHSAENYVARLIQKGYRVAICDQTEAPSKATKLVRREVTRIVTPGTAMNAGVLRSRENSYLAAVFVNGSRAGLAMWTSRRANSAPPNWNLLKPRLLWNVGGPRGTGSHRSLHFPALPEDRRRALGLRSDYASRSLCDHFHLMALDGCGLEGRALATGAAAAVLHYLRETQRSALEHLERPLLRSLRRVGPGLDHRPESRTSRAFVSRRIERRDAGPRA